MQTIANKCFQVPCQSHLNGPILILAYNLLVWLPLFLTFLLTMATTRIHTQCSIWVVFGWLARSLAEVYFIVPALYVVACYTIFVLGFAFLSNKSFLVSNHFHQVILSVSMRWDVVSYHTVCKVACYLFIVSKYWLFHFFSSVLYLCELPIFGMSYWSNASHHYYCNHIQIEAEYRQEFSCFPSFSLCLSHIRTHSHSRRSLYKIICTNDKWIKPLIFHISSIHHNSVSVG